MPVGSWLGSREKHRLNDIEMRGDRRASLHAPEGHSGGSSERFDTRILGWKCADGYSPDALGRTSDAGHTDSVAIVTSHRFGDCARQARASLERRKLWDETDSPCPPRDKVHEFEANTRRRQTADTSPRSAGQEGCTIIQRTGKLSLIIALPAKAAATTAAASMTSATPMGAATATAKSSTLRTGFVHCERTSIQVLAVEPLNRSLHVLFIGKFDETKTPGLTCHLVANNHCGNSLKPSVRHEFAE